ncbi:hypothetical protein STCU_09236 [Strigomonas culicis]|nr:hypothetical protein STCU_09236 [Strigomonas culicis]|eukprot:EPY19927.1 hypothetical protein STCU_09236 [Strigomonas culicis]
MGMAVLRAESGLRGHHAEGTAAAAQLTNALMETLLTCGYTHVRAVPSSLYDRMGAAGVSPTMRTYELVMLALSLEGNTAEAASVHRFLRERHGEHLTVGSFNALLLGHREDRAFDRCDALWQELVDLRWPRANVLSAELYLRSIVDHSYTPTSGPLQRFGNISTVEKKKVPLVLAQMADLGIPRTHLSRALTDEVEDALRKFSLYRDRFYQWGRAVKQFDFIEFRRRNGWMYDLHLMNTATRQSAVARDPTNPNASVAAAGTMELPAFFSERPSWERQALEGVLFTSDRRERTEDVRAGDFYYDDTRSIQARGSTWMNQVPQSRYDQLYGVGHPDIAKIGIRRHLDVEYVNRQEVMDRDAALMRKSVSGGRRLRQRVEGARTHRNEGSLVRGKKK